MAFTCKPVMAVLKSSEITFIMPLKDIITNEGFKNLSRRLQF